MLRTPTSRALNCWFVCMFEGTQYHCPHSPTCTGSFRSVWGWDRPLRTFLGVFRLSWNSLDKSIWTPVSTWASGNLPLGWCCRWSWVRPRWMVGLSVGSSSRLSSRWRWRSYQGMRVHGRWESAYTPSYFWFQWESLPSSSLYSPEYSISFDHSSESSYPK